MTDYAWVVAVVRFGSQTERLSTLGHLTTPAIAWPRHQRTLCGVELAVAAPAPDSFVRCQRCIDARSKA